VGVVSVSVARSSFRNQKQFPHPETISAATATLFFFTVKILVQNYENAGVIEHMKTWSISKTSRKKSSWLEVMSKK